MIKICQIKYGEIIWWQRRWLEEEDHFMEKKNFHCLEERSLIKSRVVGYVQKSSHQH